MPYPKRMGPALHLQSVARAEPRDPKPHRDARLRDDVVAKDLSDARAGRRTFSPAYQAWLEANQDAVR
jgi:hypothetical protein